MTWTADQETRLIVLHNSGASTGIIAEEFGMTRNMIVGKLSRLRGEMARALRRGLPFRLPAIRAGRAPTNLHTLDRRRARRARVSKPSAYVSSLDPPKPKPQSTGSIWVLFEDLERNMCRWPRGDRVPFEFCGDSTDGGLGMYCHLHACCSYPWFAKAHGGIYGEKENTGAGAAGTGTSNADGVVSGEGRQ